LSNTLPNVRFSPTPGEGERATRGVAQRSDVTAGRDVRELLGPYDPKIRAGSADSRYSIADIVVFDERRANQLLELRILEKLKPFQVGK